MEFGCLFYECQGKNQARENSWRCESRKSVNSALENSANAEAGREKTDVEIYEGVPKEIDSGVRHQSGWLYHDPRESM